MDAFASTHTHTETHSQCSHSCVAHPRTHVHQWALTRKKERGLQPDTIAQEKVKCSLSYFTIEASPGLQSRLLSAPLLPARDRASGTGQCTLQICPRNSAESCSHHLSKWPRHLAGTVSLRISSSSRCGHSYYPHLQGGSKAQRDGNLASGLMQLTRDRVQT